jgi:hypothetical protein
MNLLTKNLLASAVVGTLALTGAVTAEEEVKHKVIEIKAVKNHDVNVWVESDGSSETHVFSADQLVDSGLLEEKLSNLDEETRKTVMDALQGIHMSGDGEAHVSLEKVFVMNNGDSQRVEFIGGEDANIDIEVIGKNGHKMVRKHFIHADGDNSILKGHTDAIAKLIERGEFSRDELDKIQAALDAKR